MSTDILMLLRGFQPYKDGNRLIWALNRIRRQGAHRIIVPVGNASAGMHVHQMTFNGSGQVPAPQWNNEKNELIFAVTAPTAKLDCNLNINFYLAFGEVEGLAGESVVGALSAIAPEVERIVLNIEVEARRIGLIT